MERIRFNKSNTKPQTITVAISVYSDIKYCSCKRDRFRERSRKKKRSRGGKHGWVAMQIDTVRGDGR